MKSGLISVEDNKVMGAQLKITRDNILPLSDFG